MRKRILTIFAAALLLSGCTQNVPAADLPFTGEMPAQLTMDDLNERTEFSELTDGCLTALEGRFADFPINNTEDAFLAVASVADLLGVQDFREEIRFYSQPAGYSYELYAFSQYYKGLPVEGSHIMLYVDKETGYAERLYSSYVPDITVSPEPKLSAKEAASAIKKAYDVKVTEKPQLVIWLNYESAIPCLAWHLKTDSDFPSEVWLDAHSSSVLYVEYPPDYFGGA